MSTIASELERIATAKANIATAIEGKGVAVPGSARFDDFPALIDSITGGGVITGYSEADIPVALQDGALYGFLSTNGDLFISSSVLGAGIWKLGIASGTFMQVNTNNQSWQYWFEDSTGNVFVSSNVVNGIFKWDGSAFVSVYSGNTSWMYWFEDSTGNVFVSSNGSGTGILKWDGSAFTQVYAAGQHSRFWFESSAGDLFVGSSISNSGILKWNGSAFAQVHSVSQNWQYWFEDSAGDVFVSSSSSTTGILKWNGSAFAQVHSVSQNWQYWFEDSEGNVFVSSSNANGILKWNGSAFAQVHSVSQNWQYWFEDSEGNVFVSSRNSNTGILKWDGSMFTQVYAFAASWQMIDVPNVGVFAQSLTINGRLELGLDNQFTFSDKNSMPFPFGDDLSIFGDANTSCRLSRGGNLIILDNFYDSNAVLRAGPHAAAISLDKQRVLYTLPNAA